MRRAWGRQAGVVTLRSRRLVAGIAATLAVAAPPALPGRPATEEGETRVVPDGHKARGAVYDVVTDKDRRVYFESNAPPENIKGQGNDVIGYTSFAGVMELSSPRLRGWAWGA